MVRTVHRLNIEMLEFKEPELSRVIFLRVDNL